VKSFVNQIAHHDECVKNIEEKWNESDENRKDFHKKKVKFYFRNKKKPQKLYF